jgi:hypothetical protein
VLLQAPVERVDVEDVAALGEVAVLVAVGDVVDPDLDGGRSARCFPRTPHHAQWYS